MGTILKIADYLAERIKNEPEGEIFYQKDIKQTFLKELVENRIEKLESSEIYIENVRKISKENEIMFLKNILKRLIE